MTGIQNIPVQMPSDPSGPGTTTGGVGSLPCYVSGPETGLVTAVYHTLLVGPFDSGIGNPITFFGATGVGKSHLALGLADAWSQAHRNEKEMVLSGADWARSFVAAYREGRLNAWRETCRNLGMLVIDDTLGLRRKQSAQRELVALIDSLTGSGARCLFTCRTNPNIAHELIPQLASRLTGGLTVPITTPGPSARAEIICQFANQLGKQIAPSAVDCLVQQGPISFLEIRSIIIQCSLLAGQHPAIDLEIARQALLRIEKLEPIPLKKISTAVARYFQMPNVQLTGPTRRKAVTLARGIGILLSRQLTDATLKEIGRHYGNRDHTTVLHACRKIDQLSHTDADVQTAMDELKRHLQSRYAGTP